MFDTGIFVRRGAVECVENGFFQKELANEAYQFQKSIEKKDRIWVGVNEYKEEISKTSKADLEGAKLKIFADFLSKL